MKVITWSSTEGDTPEKWRWTARIEVDGDFLPVTFHGGTREAVMARASTFWSDENDALHKKHGRMIADAKRRAKAKKPDPAPPIVEDDEEEAV
jgi:hypothetical protein